MNELNYILRMPRLNRSRFLVYHIGLFLVVPCLLIVIGSIVLRLFELASDSESAQVSTLAILAGAGVAGIFHLKFCIQRFHDFDSPTWYVVLCILPGLNALALLLLCFLPGNEHENKYGSPPAYSLRTTLKTAGYLVLLYAALVGIAYLVTYFFPRP